MTSSTKPKVDNIIATLPEEEQAAAICNIACASRILLQFGLVVFEICERTK